MFDKIKEEVKGNLLLRKTNVKVIANKKGERKFKENYKNLNNKML